MRILWYHPHPAAGVNLSAQNVAMAGHDVMFVCLQEYFGEQVVRSSEGHKYSLVPILPHFSRAARQGPTNRLHTFVINVRRAIRRHRLAVWFDPDVIFVQTAWHYVDWFAFRRLSRIAPIVLQVHDIWPHQMYLPAGIERHLLAWTYQACSSWLVYEDGLQLRLEREFGTTEHRTTVAPFPLPTVPQGLPAVETTEANAVRLLFFGSIRPDKGIGLLLKALEEAEQGDDFVYELRIIGRGDADLEQQIVRFASSRDWVKIDLRRVSDDEKWIHLKWADLVVLPYTTEWSQSAVLFDAYAAGCPVLATTGTAPSRTVETHAAGFCVAPTPTAIAQGLSAIAREPQRLVDASRQVAALRSAWTSEAQTKQMLAAFGVASGAARNRPPVSHSTLRRFSSSMMRGSWRSRLWRRT